LIGPGHQRRRKPRPSDGVWVFPRFVARWFALAAVMTNACTARPRRRPGGEEARRLAASTRFWTLVVGAGLVLAGGNPRTRWFATPPARPSGRNRRRLRAALFCDSCQSGNPSLCSRPCPPQVALPADLATFAFFGHRQPTSRTPSRKMAPREHRAGRSGAHGGDTHLDRRESWIQAQLGAPESGPGRSCAFGPLS